MPDTQTALSAIGAMTQKQREEFLVAALSQQSIETLDAVLRKLDLKELPVNSRVSLVFGMGLSPVAHAFRGGPARELRWVVPQVPDHLRPLVYATSRLINEFQETLLCLQNGRGDFVKAFSLLNPETMLDMVTRFTDEMSAYTQQLRDANGRFNRSGPQRQRRGAGTRPPRTEAGVQTAPEDSPVTTPVEPDPATEPKSRRTTARTRTKAQEAPAGDSGENNDDDSGVAAEIPAEEPQAASNAGAVPASAQLSEAEMSAFGFDVRSIAAEGEEEKPQDQDKGEE